MQIPKSFIVSPIMNHKIYDLILQHVTLSPTISATGYRSCKCPVCNDYKPRMGIKNDNGKIKIHCFNCSLNTSYNEDSRYMVDEFKKVLHSFNIPDEQIKTAMAAKFWLPQSVKTTPKIFEAILPTPIDLPKDTYPLQDDTTIWKTIAIEYLNLRGLSETNYDWYLSSNNILRKYLIIPYFYENQVIYWQGRNLELSSKNRYQNPPIPRDNIIFNFNEMFRYTNEPLFVTEGVFDAISIFPNAISLGGSTLSPFKINHLQRVSKNREVIVIIDKDDPGKKLGDRVIQLGLSVSYFDGDIVDVNDALQKMGRIWTLQHLMKNKKNNLNAKVWLQFLNDHSEQKII